MNARENAIHQRVAVPLDDERRRHQRIHLQIPLFVRGKDTQGEQFMELPGELMLPRRQHQPIGGGRGRDGDVLGFDGEPGIVSNAERQSGACRRQAQGTPF